MFVTGIVAISILVAFCQSDVIPLKYNITINPNLQTLTFNADIIITVYVETSTQNISLNIRNLNIESVALKDQKNTDIGGISFDVDNEANNLIIHSTSASLSIDEVYDLEIVYNGVINQDKEGFYAVKYITKTKEERILALINLQFSKARQVFPLFDSPKHPAPFVLNIIKSSNITSISSMVKISENIINSSAIIDTFATSGTIPADIFAFAILDCSRNINEEYPIYRTNDLSNTGFLEEWSEKIVKKFQDLYPMKFNKIQQVVVPDKALSADVLSNAGLIFYRESAVQYDPEVHSSKRKQEVIQNIAYGIIRQWYQNADTTTWFSTFWLAEGISGLYEHEVLESLEPEWQITNQFVVGTLFDLFQEDKDETAISLKEDNNVIEHNRKMFSHKAFALVRMIYNQDSPGDILAYPSLPEAVPWQESPGFPVVSINRTSNVLSFSQDLEPVRSIPISVQEELVSKSDDHRYDVILDTATKEWLLSSDSGSWYIVNLKRFAYFVPSYDDNNWSALIIFLRNLNISKVDAVDRALILENALFAAESGTLSYQNFFELLGYITRETDYFPIDIFIRVTNRVKAQLAQSVLQPQFLAYIRDVSNHLFDLVGTTDSDTDTQLERFNRGKVLFWLCQFDHQMCQQQMIQLFTNGDKVHPDVEEAVYCGAMKSNNFADLAKIYKQYSTYGKKNVLKSIACATDKTIISEFILAQVNDSDVIKLRPEDRVFAFVAAIDGNNDGANIGLAVIKQHLDDFLQMYSEDDLRVVFTELSKRLFTAKQLQMVDAIIDCLTDEQQLNYNSLFSAVKSRIQRNIEWSAKYLDDIESWLSNQNSNDTSSGETTSPSGPPGGGANLKINITLLILSILLGMYG